MPAVNQYPTPVFFGGPGGPFWKSFLYQGPEYKVTVSAPYEDGARDRNLDSTTGVHRWKITYAGLHEDEQAQLDNHNNSAYGEAYGFNFYDHRTNTLWTNVHYESYKRGAGISKSDTQMKS
ncbi:MAG: hypothetical protein AUG51_19425 [Acidobacteria bacterium 13_1_20CM_3_53_8]|nr:MAG: hypothetical protein AUG51_19425 [Acidobacteria bacterium 13_1_20CM_3_53_8]